MQESSRGGWYQTSIRSAAPFFTNRWTHSFSVILAREAEAKALLLVSELSEKVLLEREDCLSRLAKVRDMIKMSLRHDYIPRYSSRGFIFDFEQ